MLVLRVDTACCQASSPHLGVIVLTRYSLCPFVRSPRTNRYCCSSGCAVWTVACSRSANDSLQVCCILAPAVSQHACGSPGRRLSLQGSLPAVVSREQTALSSPWVDCRLLAASFSSVPRRCSSSLFVAFALSWSPSTQHSLPLVSVVCARTLCSVWFDC